MSPVSTLITTFNLLVGSIAVEYFTGLPVVWLLILGSALWAAYDARITQPWRYRTGLANRPPMIFVGVLLLWIVVLPWYLIVRGRIRGGTLPLKAEFELAPAEPRSSPPQPADPSDQQ